MTIVMLDKGRERNFVPSYSPYGYYGLPGLITSMWSSRMCAFPDIIPTIAKYQWEANLYDMKKRTNVVLCTVTVFRSANNRKNGRAYMSQQVVKDMAKTTVVSKTVTVINRE